MRNQNKTEAAVSKTTMATIKSFIRKSGDNLLIRYGSHFDGMTDCVVNSEDRKVHKVKPTTRYIENTLGITGAWVVGRSRDSFSKVDDSEYFGYLVYNSCGSFELLIKK